MNSRLVSTFFILDQIKKRGVKLNSFVSASGIAAYPDSISEISSEENSDNITSSFINQVVINYFKGPIFYAVLRFEFYRSKQISRKFEENFKIF